MRLVGLISGGKDSIFNLHQCVSAGHEIVALANVEPEAKEEIDSYMYQTVGFHTLSVLATALGLPIYRQSTKGKAVCKSKNYVPTALDEVEDLYSLLKKVKKEVSFDGVAVGAIASDYQRTRVESVCRRLNLQCFAYLWRRDEEELLQEMIDSDLDAVLIKVASMGLLPETHLGMHIKDIKPHLVALNKKFGVSICGEGGEYETLTINCPLYNRVISLTDSEKVVVSNDAFAPVAYLNVKNITLGRKSSDPEFGFSNTSIATVKNPYDYIEDCVDRVSLTLFPQKTPKAAIEDLPFPFSQDTGADSSRLNVREYWKSRSLLLNQPSTTTISRPETTKNLILDKSLCNLNYTSGWSVFGNIHGTSMEGVFMSLSSHLKKINYSVSDIVFINLFVKNIKDFEEVNRAYADFVPNYLPPARTCVETKLQDGIKIIMSVLAHKQVSKSQQVLGNSQSQRETMHVESISHWAPATIGHYSQCVRVGDFYHISGQIPLIPGSMEILNKPIYHQCKLTLRHIHRIMVAMNEKLSFKNVLLAVCYVTSEKIIESINSLWTHITGCNKALVTAFVVTGLPMQAQLEWEVIAHISEEPEIIDSEEIIEDYNVVIKRYVSKEPFASALIAKISISKLSPARSLTIITDDGIKEILKVCLQYLGSEAKNIGPPLFNFKVYFRTTDVSTFDILYKFAKSCSQKVVVTGIPVVACEEPDLFLTITGFCL